MIDEIKKEIEELTPQLIQWRRNFHRYPEVAFMEEKTSQVLKEYLENLGLPVRSMAKTGLRADLQGQPGGKTVALRADIDALPLQEENECDYKSENPGAMHACGHDGHMDVVMGAAKILAESFEKDTRRKEELMKLSDICWRVPAQPCQGLWDAVQAKWLVYLVAHSLITPYSATHYFPSEPL